MSHEEQISRRKSIDQICDEFESAWMTGRAPRIEDYITRVCSESQDALLHEMLLAEWDMLRMAGSTVQLTEYQQRFNTRSDVVSTTHQKWEDISAATEVGDSACDETLLQRKTESSDEPETELAIPGYELLGVLGRGGMGVVYKARQLKPNRFVALKMIRLGKFAAESDNQRFVAEVDAIAKLEHPNIVSVYEIGTHRGEHFFTMQLVTGTNFAGYLQSSEFNTEVAIEIFLKVCEAVAYCHERDIVHRDLKPSNILLDDANTPKLTDFGLAKHLDSVSNLTQTGDILGTPGYIAPEQTDPDAVVDARADIYSLGAVLYRILTGQRPLEVGDRDVLGIIEQLRSHEIRPPRLLDKHIARDLEAICMKCLDTNPQRRYANAVELADDLHRFRAGEPVNARPIPLRRHLTRWARRNPRLAVTWIALLAFYVYHLINMFVLDEPGLEQLHLTASFLTLVWAAGAYGFHRISAARPRSTWPVYGWATMEVILLTILMASGSGADSSLVAVFPVLAAGSALRFRTTIVIYVTVLAFTAYGFLVWQTLTGENPEQRPSLYVPVGLATLCIGYIQYLTVRRFCGKVAYPAD